MSDYEEELLERLQLEDEDDGDDGVEM